jgi:hypothetical protein
MTMPPQRGIKNALVNNGFPCESCILNGDSSLEGMYKIKLILGCDVMVDANI